MVVDALTDVVADRASKNAVIEAVQDSVVAINQRIEGSERRLGEQLDRVEGRLGAMKKRFDRLEGMLAKIIDGQAVSYQNDMELKRRLDERK